MIVETTEYNAKLISVSLTWCFVEMPQRIFRGIGEYMSAIAYIFSFAFLLKTLIYPWKNQAYAYPSKGFDLQRIMEVFASNMVSRVVGFFIRFFTIIAGLVLEIFVVALGAAFFVVWVFAPIVFIVLLILSL